jgi:hypothetical protein
VKEISKYKLDVVGVEEVRLDGGGTKSPGEYTFFCGNEIENDESGTGYFYLFVLYLCLFYCCCYFVRMVTL